MTMTVLAATMLLSLWIPPRKGVLRSAYPFPAKRRVKRPPSGDL